MSKFGYAREVQRIAKHKINQRRDKLKEELQELDYNYRDFPWDRTLKAMERRQEELDELDDLSDRIEGFDFKQEEIDDYRVVLRKILVLLENCEQPHNILKAIQIIRSLRDIESVQIDESFIINSERGVW